VGRIEERVQCKACGSYYYPHKSSSSLRLTWCTILCEVKDLGYHLRSFEEDRYYNPTTEDTIIHVTEQNEVDDTDDGEKGELVPV
jgi:hypothetical protein